MIVYDAFDAKLVGTPLGHAAILERRNKEDAQSVLSVVRRALRWTRRVEDGESSAHPTGKVFPRTGPERATLGSVRVASGGRARDRIWVAWARAYLAEELPGPRLRLRKRRGEHGRARGRAQALARRQPGDRGTQRHVSVRASRTTPWRKSLFVRARAWWPARLRRSMSSGRHEPVAEPARAHCAARGRSLPGTRCGSRGEKRKSCAYGHSV
jgi:hypothetical protein